MDPLKRLVRVIVTADSGADLEALAAMVSEPEVDSELGVIQGFANPEQLGLLRATEGVHGVEVDMSHKIAPPESDVQ